MSIILRNREFEFDIKLAIIQFSMFLEHTLLVENLGYNLVNSQFLKGRDGTLCQLKNI